MLNKLKLVLAGSIAAAAMISGGAQAATETVTADARIIPAVTLGTPVNMNFGTIAADATGGSVVIAAASGATAACATLTCVGTSNPGSIAVTSASGETVSVSFVTPGAITLRAGPGATDPTMSLTPSLSATSFTSTGTDTVYVGGTLTVAASQAAGTYSGDIEVNIDYN